jgi:hypothetical protein
VSPTTARRTGIKEPLSQGYTAFGFRVVWYAIRRYRLKIPDLASERRIRAVRDPIGGPRNFELELRLLRCLPADSNK